MRRQQPQAPDPVELVTHHIEVGKEAGANAPALKVLLLEDRDDFRGILRDYLVSCSYDVISVSSGTEGLREIMKARFDLIICDMMMPRMGGEMFYWAATRVRPATREHFIFFTGHKNNPAIDFFFRRIKARVLFKPFKLAALDLVIDDIIRKPG